MSPNNGIIVNGVLRPRLLNIPLASFSIINFDFLVPYVAHYDNSIVLLLIFKTLRFMFCTL